MCCIAPQLIYFRISLLLHRMVSLILQELYKRSSSSFFSSSFFIVQLYRRNELCEVGGMYTLFTCHTSVKKSNETNIKPYYSRGNIINKAGRRAGWQDAVFTTLRYLSLATKQRSAKRFSVLFSASMSE